MSCRVVLSFGLLLALTIAVQPVWPQVTDSALAQPLGPLEKQMATRVTLEFPEISVGDLLRDIASRTGLNLMADVTAVSRKIAISVRDVPAKMVLDDLAALLGCSWRRGGTVLLLTPMPALSLSTEWMVLTEDNVGPRVRRLWKLYQSFTEAQLAKLFKRVAFTPEAAIAFYQSGITWADLTDEQRQLLEQIVVDHADAALRLPPVEQLRILEVEDGSSGYDWHIGIYGTQDKDHTLLGITFPKPGPRPKVPPWEPEESPTEG